MGKEAGFRWNGNGDHLGYCELTKGYEILIMD